MFVGRIVIHDQVNVEVLRVRPADAAETPEIPDGDGGLAFGKDHARRDIQGRK